MVLDADILDCPCHEVGDEIKEIVHHKEGKDYQEPENKGCNLVACIIELDAKRWLICVKMVLCLLSTQDNSRDALLISWHRIGPIVTGCDDTSRS